MRPVKLMPLALAAMLPAVVTTGCATRKYVDQSVAALEARQTARMDQIDRTAHDALERAIAAGKLAEGKFLYSVTLTDDAVKFASGRWELSAEAQKNLGELVARLKGENRDVYLEVQGHTDDTGSAAMNHTLGLRRAEAVRLYLYDRGVPLNRMATISYGEDKPVAANADDAGRAANRRVVVMVLS